MERVESAVQSHWLGDALSSLAGTDDRDGESMSLRVRALCARARRRMAEPQRVWRAPPILDDAETASLPLPLRKASGFRCTLAALPIAIEDDDLIAGNALLDGMIVRPVPPDYVTSEEREAAEERGLSSGYHLAHKTPDYARLMGQGLLGIVDDIREQRAAVAVEAPSAQRDETLALLDAMAVECQATIDLAQRFAHLARGQAEACQNVERRRDLSRMAEACSWVPAHPPRTFYEAVQSFWLVHYAFSCTQTILSCGRIDQYLWPYLQADLASGSVTLAEAQETIDALWIRCNDRAQNDRTVFVGSPDAREDDDTFRVANRDAPWAAGHRWRTLLACDRTDAVNHWGENILLSGLRPDGTDGTNPLTYLCLNAQQRLAFTSPVVTVRLHRDSPPELVQRTAEVLKDDGGGMPYINNDDVLVPAYVDLGIPIEDARDYANSNCWETLIQGMSDQELVRGINMLLLLELALQRGHSWRHGHMGPDTGDPRGWSSIDDLMHAWKAQADHMLRQAIDYIGRGVTDGTLDHSGHGPLRCYPLLSALTKDCIARGKDVTRGGARYTIWHVMGEALANTVDAIVAVKRLVFDAGTLSMDELLSILDADWDGHDTLRQSVLTRLPKYANDDPEADAIGAELMAWFGERARHYARRWSPRVLFSTAIGTFSWVASTGHEVGATPDGRRAGEAVAANLSPAPGADRCGPVAAIRSSVQMHVNELAGGAPLDLRLARRSLAGDDGTGRLAALIQGFVDLGGNMLTLTVTDVAELKRAMVEPETYRHLRVRMGGWSAYFCMLSREQQLLQIRRGEQGL